MSTRKVSVNGLELEFPVFREGTEILFSDLPIKEQKWKRQEVPEHFEDGWWESPDEEQIAFMMRELDRILNGVWISIKGDVIWITGINYFYLNYWVLDIGQYPDYRDTDVKFFWWWKICENNPACLGTIFTKFRRQGASSRGACISIYYGITETNIRCGTISKTNKDSKDVLFQGMIINGFKQLEDFLKPQSTGSDKSASALVLAKQGERMSKTRKIASKQGGLNNKIDFATTTINSYDGSRLRYLLLDESGKFPTDVPFGKYWNIVRRCFVVGVKRVGIAYVPSTVNEMDKGGAEFKKVWDASNHLKKDFSGTTVSGLFKFFQPAYEGFEGYIGEYGESIVENPTPEQTAFLKANGCPMPEIGAKEYQLRVRKDLVAMGDDVALSEYIRQFPHVEREAFYKVAKDSHFNPMHINQQMEAIDENGLKPRRVNFYRDTISNKIRMIDDVHGRWWVIWDFPNDTLSNKCTTRMGMLEPLNVREFAMGCDPFSHTFTSGKGSMAAAFIHRKYNPLDPHNSDMPIAMYFARPKNKKTVFQDWAFAGEYFGCKIGVEENNDEYYSWFTENQLDRFLVWTPIALARTNQNKTIKPRPGIPANSPKAIEYHLTIMVEYMLHNWNKIWFKELLEDMMDFDVEDRTIFDLTMAFGYSLITAREMDARPIVEVKSMESFIPTYKLDTGSRF
jgi:hypothetical protein